VGDGRNGGERRSMKGWKEVKAKINEKVDCVSFLPFTGTKVVGEEKIAMRQQ
jgi:hypothetical protein